MAKAVAEKSAQAMIVELATLRRWRSYHTFDSRKSSAGFPDLVLLRDRVVYAELKRVGEKPSKDQVEWLDELARVGCEVYLWTIDDLVEISRIVGQPWEFCPDGRVVRLSPPLEGPMLRDGSEFFAPQSAWIPGKGRRDA